MCLCTCPHPLSSVPQYVKAYLRRGMAYEALEKWKKASMDFKQAKELDPGNRQASEGLQRATKQLAMM